MEVGFLVNENGDFVLGIKSPALKIFWIFGHKVMNLLIRITTLVIYLCFYNILFLAMNSFIETTTLVALLINTIALIIVIYQTILTKKSLIITKESIDDAKTQRQLEILPKVFSVINVREQLEGWEKDLQRRKDILQKGVNRKDDKIIKIASSTTIKSPKDLSLNKFLYTNMPSWLRQLWMSGAQYYYNAIAPLSYICKDEKPDYKYAQVWINEDGKNSLEAISKLLEYLKDMVPSVILNTPASLSDEKFFLKDCGDLANE